MKLFQHVYGRVSRGYEGGAPGYQVAALSPELAHQKKLIQQLNKLSFYRYQVRNGSNPLRYSFFRAGEDMLALGCVRMSHDLTGAAASFAHHFLWEKNDFLSSTQSPVSLLRSLPFINSENELPEDRVLPAVERSDEHDDSASSDEWNQKALFLVDCLLSGDKLGIPMIVIPESDMWFLLTELFKLLPRQEAALVGFSSLFCQSVEYADAYRMVFVPDKIHVPSMTQIFDVFFPEDLSASANEHELTIFWHRYPELGDYLLSFINLLRHGSSDTGYALSYLKSLLQAGSDFRAVIERMNVEGIFQFLLEDTNILGDYWRAGARFSYEVLKKLLWEAPEQRFPVLLAFSRNEYASILLHDALLDIARKITTQAITSDSFAIVKNAGLTRDFYSICEDRLSLDEVMYLAERLTDEPGYTGELHRHVTVWLLQNRNRQADRSIWEWLHRNHKPSRLSSAAVTTDVNLFSYFPCMPILDNFQLDPEDYELLANWAWDEGTRVGILVHECVKNLFDSRNRQKFFNLIADRLKHMKTELAGDCLEVIVRICHPQAAEIRLLINVIKKRRGSRWLASRFLAVLKESGGIDSQIHEQLINLARKKGVVNFISRMFRRNTN